MKDWIVRAFLSGMLLFLLLPQALAMEFTDANGRKVSVEAPERVVSLYHSYGDAWLLSGGELVGTIEDSFETPDDRIRDDIQNLGGHTQPNMELLFALEPDFVLLSADVATHIQIGTVLEQAGIPCAYFSTPDWRSYMDMIRLFTEMTGREDLYQAQVEAVQKPIEGWIAAAQESRHYGQSTVLLLRAFSSGVKAKNSEGTVAGNLLRDMGLVNLADGDSRLNEGLSMESIILADPDYIFVITMGSNTEAAMASLSETLTGNPAWNTLSAVQEGRYVILDRELFHYHPNSRWAQAYELIADLLQE